MKCDICGQEALPGKIICSDKCAKIKSKMLDLNRKFTPTHGCANCLGDLHQGCTEECNIEFKKSGEFWKGLWELISLIYPQEKHETN